MSKLAISVTIFAAMTATASPALAASENSCTTVAAKVEQIVRIMPNSHPDRAKAFRSVEEAKKAARANDDEACWAWLGKAQAYAAEDWQGPVVGGRHRQPTEAEVESRQRMEGLSGDSINRQNEREDRELDEIYRELKDQPDSVR